MCAWTQHYFTFGKDHTDPLTKQSLSGLWVVIESASYKKAKNYMIQLYGNNWEGYFSEKEFLIKYRNYPNGCYARYEID